MLENRWFKKPKLFGNVMTLIMWEFYVTGQKIWFVGTFFRYESSNGQIIIVNGITDFSFRLLQESYTGTSINPKTKFSMSLTIAILRLTYGRRSGK